MNVVIINAWQILTKGGPMMWPILALSVVATAIAIDRLVFLQKAEKLFIQQRALLLQSLRLGKLKETLKLCESHAGLVPLIVKAAIITSASSSEMIKLSMEEVCEHQQISIKKHISLLGMIVNIAPLLGLLGTVNSMTVVFHASVIRSNVLNPSTAGELASGIWQALLTTTAGLVVGIFAYVVYSFCMARIVVYAIWTDHLMVETLCVLTSLKELKQTAVQGEYES